MSTSSSDDESTAARTEEPPALFVPPAQEEESDSSSSSSTSSSEEEEEAEESSFTSESSAESSSSNNSWQAHLKKQVDSEDEDDVNDLDAYQARASRSRPSDAPKKNLPERKTRPATLANLKRGEDPKRLEILNKQKELDEKLRKLRQAKPPAPSAEKLEAQWEAMRDVKRKREDEEKKMAILEERAKKSREQGDLPSSDEENVADYRLPADVSEADAQLLMDTASRPTTVPSIAS